ncbi:MAG: hypothetical protein ABI771_13705 [Betaproteobacteria bacterium]
MRHVFHGSLCLAFIVIATRALACGHCIEDKIAAVYDYDVVTQALARKHEVAFFAMAGELIASAETHRLIKRETSKVVGVDPGSVRVSVENASLSLAYDPRAYKLSEIERELTRRLAPRGLSPGLMRTIDGSASGAGR